MAASGITGVRLRCRVITTVPDPDRQPVPDLFERDFTAPAPNLKYVGDITYLPCAGGRPGGGGALLFLYLATAIDCSSRRLVGWSIADHMRTDLVADALLAAAATRGSLAGAIFHSDHGAQYGAKSYAGLCDQVRGALPDERGGCQRRQRPGGVLQRGVETGDPRGAAGWDSPEQSRRVVFVWLLARANTTRSHSACGQRPPAAYEAEHFTSTLPIAA